MTISFLSDSTAFRRGCHIYHIRDKHAPSRVSFSQRMLRDLDPRHSLAGGIIWLMVALAASFAIAASVWAGSVAREIVVQQHVRRLSLETQQLASDLGQAIGARIEAVRSSGALPPDQLFAHLKSSYPGLGWIGVTDATGA